MKYGLGAGSGLVEDLDSVMDDCLDKMPLTSPTSKPIWNKPVGNIVKPAETSVNVEDDNTSSHEEMAPMITSVANWLNSKK